VRRPVAANRLGTAVDLVTVPTLLDHANVHITTQS
jgi:hypothetical protein